MCEYVEAVVIHLNCRRPTQHKTIKRLYKRCAGRPQPLARCAEPVLNSSLAKLETTEQRRGPCRHCRDLAVSVGTLVYEHVRLMPQESVLMSLLMSKDKPQHDFSWVAGRSCPKASWVDFLKRILHV